MAFIPNKIQMNPGVQPVEKTLYLRNVYLGVDTKQTYGPTSSTDWWNGYPVPTGGYVTYLNKGSIEPSIYMCNNDSDLIENVQQVFTYAPPTIQDALNYYFNESNNICVNFDYDDLDCEYLQFMVDFGFTPSYPRTGAVVRDLGKREGIGNLINNYSWEGNGSNNQKGDVVVNNTGPRNDGLQINAQLSQPYNITTLSIWCLAATSQTTPYTLFESDGNTPDLFLTDSSVGAGFINLGAEISVDGSNFTLLSSPSQYMILDGSVHNIVIRFTSSSAQNINNMTFFNNLGFNKGMIGKIFAAFAWSKLFTNDDADRHYNALQGRLI